MFSRAMILRGGLLAALVVCWAGCGQKPSPADEAPWETRTPDQSYTVRGRVERLPDVRTTLKIHHERIEDFRDRAGEAVGMNAMAMEFPSVRDGALPDDLAVGDIVEFDFEVYWTEAAPRWRVTRMTRLGPSTTLDLGAAPLAREYTVRGEIVSLPDPADPAKELMIRHEAIPDLVDSEGKVIGMQTMTMPFPTLAEGVTLAGLERGDKVEFVLRVTWEGARARFPIVSIRELPTETELDFGD